MGYKPGEWEHLPPIAIELLWDAMLWRRSREIELIAISTIWIAGGWRKVDPHKVLDSFPGYKRDEG